jgi:hypothetical protein
MLRMRIAAAAAFVLASMATAGGASAAPSAGAVHGDAWVDFSIGREAVRRFTIDAHGNPYKIVDGRMVVGDAHGTVTFDHHMLQGPDAGKDFYGHIDVDYLMTGGPVAVVSGIVREGVSGAPAGSRVSLSVYASPKGHRFDRVGFSWGVVDPRCVPIGLAPAPFAPVVRFNGFLGGYTVTPAELPSMDGFQGGAPGPAPCSGP